MENASKALIIAGAILLSILIISLGIMIFQKSKAATEGIDLTSTQVQTYNEPFVAYVGAKVKGSDVKMLLRKVQTHNSSQSDASLKIEVTVSGGAFGTNNDCTNVTDSTNITKAEGNTPLGKVFKVEAVYSDDTGYIKGIKISNP